MCTNGNPHNKCELPLYKINLVAILENGGVKVIVVKYFLQTQKMEKLNLLCFPIYP